jgi:hypothetical protein
MTSASLSGFSTQDQVDTGFKNIEEYNVATDAGFTSKANMMKMFIDLPTKTRGFDGEPVNDLTSFISYAVYLGMSPKDLAYQYSLVTKNNL